MLFSVLSACATTGSLESSERASRIESRLSIIEAKRETLIRLLLEIQLKTGRQNVLELAVMSCGRDSETLRLSEVGEKFVDLKPVPGEPDKKSGGCKEGMERECTENFFLTLEAKNDCLAREVVREAVEAWERAKKSEKRPLPPFEDQK